MSECDGGFLHELLLSEWSSLLVLPGLPNSRLLLKREATQASGIQGLTSSNGTRAGDIWKRKEDEPRLREFRVFQDNYLGGLLKWSPWSLVYILPSFSIQD